MQNLPLATHQQVPLPVASPLADIILTFEGLAYLLLKPEALHVCHCITIAVVVGGESLQLPTQVANLNTMPSVHCLA